jgi:D-glycero-alpha-D-manno-heptose-7-phosphate kinase
MLLGIAPVRISFAGGGTDMPEYYDEFGGNVVTTCISRNTYVFLTARSDSHFQVFSSDFQVHSKPVTYKNLKSEKGTELVVSVLKYLKYKDGANLMISSDVPAGSGLGASSTLAVNLINTISKLQNKNLGDKKIAEMASHISRNILNWPIGKQDEYIAAFGGFNFIKFEKNNVKVTPININKSTLHELQNNLVLFFIGNTRSSSDILIKQTERLKNRNNEILNSLHFVKELALEMYHSLKNSDITHFGKLLNDGWEAKKKFSAEISNQRIDNIYASAIKNGATGGKLTGAGGGGHLLFYCDPTKKKGLIEKMNSFGLTHIPFNFTGRKKVHNLYDYSKM